MTRDPFEDARRAGLRIELAHLGDWGPAALVAEYDPAARAIRVNVRYAARVRDAVAHELYHHFVAVGEQKPEASHAACERAAAAFARTRYGARTD